MLGTEDTTSKLYEEHLDRQSEKNTIVNKLQINISNHKNGPIKDEITAPFLSTFAIK